MIDDEVVREVRAAREAFAASYGYNIAAMVKALHELGLASGRELVRLAPCPAVIKPNQAQQPTAAPIPPVQDFKPPEGTAAAKQ